MERKWTDVELSPVVGVGAVGSRAYMSLGPNETLIGAAGFARELATPALLLDLDAFEANLTAMAELVARRKRMLRPHVKAHKSAEVGRRQIEAGAVGLCCATVREVETMATAGLDGVLLTTPLVTPSMIRRLAAAREQLSELIVVVDSEAGVAALASAADPRRPVGVLVDIDIGQKRTGVREPEQAVRLARTVVSQPSLRYRGIQAYYGQLQQLPTITERLERAQEKWVALAAFTDALHAAGLAPEIISGGGTGTHHIDLELGPFTEIQPGSYVFMDKQYGAIELSPEGSSFRISLTIAARVTSTVQPNQVILDAGLKAMATEAGPPLVATGAAEGATYQFMGDEHGALRFPDGANPPALGDLVTLVAPHCDPTVNVHAWLHVVQDGRLVDIWPIQARGY